MANPSDSQTHETLLARLAQSGGDNQAAWLEFVDRYGRKIYGWCLRWGLQDADAQDVTQIVLLKLAQAMKEFTYDPARSFRAWLKTVTHNTWQDFVRSRRTAPLADGGDAAKERLDSVTVRDDLSHELEATFDLELMEMAMQRVRLCAAPHTWRAFVDDRGRRHPRGRGRRPAGDENRPGLRGPQHDPAAIAGGMPAARSCPGFPVRPAARRQRPASRASCRKSSDLPVRERAHARLPHAR